MAPFDAFVVFADMRTGSNFLETNLNSINGVSCLGEAFNPHFIGYPDAKDVLGFSQAARDTDPKLLLDAFRTHDGIAGFRYFSDHDPRIFDELIEDQRIAKIILTRNPLESYVSWKIAQSTGQWKLTDVARRKSAQAVFEPEEFLEHVETLRTFQLKLLNSLQAVGQTAFHIAYEDLQSLDVINGIARYLGAEGRLTSLDKSLKVQNPKPIAQKVSNVTAMEASLQSFDVFGLSRTPNFEPRRAAAVPNYVAGARAPLLYMPIKPGPDDAVLAWLASGDGVTQNELRTQMSQKDLRQWKRRNPGHRSFTVLRHPVARAHTAFCKHVLSVGEESYLQIRLTLMDKFGVDIPLSGPDENYDLEKHRTAFLAFLMFLKANLTGQTALRIDGAWCTQAAALQGFGRFSLPDRVIREETLSDELAQLAQSVGLTPLTQFSTCADDTPFALSEVYSDIIEDAVQDAYQRDYMMFGFKRWDD